MEELLARGHRVELVGDVDVEWLRRQVEALGVSTTPGMPADAFVEFALSRGTDVVMVDGYEFPADLGRGLREAGIGVATMIDAQFGAHQVADMYVDQNLGAVAGDAPGQWLLGTEYTLLRDVVVARRGEASVDARVPRVLVVFGGTDPFRGSPVALELLQATGLPVHAVVIAADPEVAEALRRVPVGPEQHVEVVGPQDDLPGLAVTCHAAISAAGSSVWELACLGIPTALVCVVDNQAEGYREATRDLALGLGHLEQLRSDTQAREAAVQQLRQLVGDPRFRADMADAAAELVDGLGRVRVADAMEELAGR